MAVGWGAKCAKFLLFIFNFFVFLAGIALLAIGIWALADDGARKYIDIVNNVQSEGAFRTVCIMIIVLGSVTALISFCGCCGAFRESSCLLLTYAVVLGIILLAQIGAGIAAAVLRKDIGKGVEDSMHDTVQHKYGQPDYKELTNTWDRMQVDLKCCGAENASEWQTSAWHKNNTNQAVPLTCCVLKNNDPKNPKPEDEKQCMQDALAHDTSSKFLNTEGCHQSLRDWIKANVDIIIGVAFGLAALLLLGIICACVLHKNKNGDYQYV